MGAKLKKLPQSVGLSSIDELIPELAEHLSWVQREAGTTPEGIQVAEVALRSGYRPDLKSSDQGLPPRQDRIGMLEEIMN